MPANAATFDVYMDALPEESRAALESLRQVIRKAAPQAEECISYGVAAFRLHGKVIAGLGAAATHCSYYPMSGTTLTTLAADLAKYDTSKGAIRFPASRPLPATLVRKLVKARIAEIAPPKPKKT